MKKTLLATAIAGAAFASGAQAATVYNEDGTKLDIYGNIQIAYYNTDSAVILEDSVTGETVVTSESSDGIVDNGTTFGFAAEHMITRDLTGYLKLEFDDIKADEMKTASDATDSGDQAYVGLKGNFGDVRLGSYDQLIDDWIQDPITNNEGFDVSDSTVAHGSGLDQETDKVTYTSPSFSGMQFAVGSQYKGDFDSADSGVDQGDSNASFFGGAKYTAGAFSIAAVYDNLDNIVFADANGDVDSVGDQYGLTAQYTVDTLRLAAKLERFDSDISDGDDTNFYGLSARYGYGNGDIYGAYQYVDVGAGTFLSELDESLQDEQDRDETYNEVILGATYNVSDAMYVWSEVAFYDREADEKDGVGVGVTYMF
ncbi:porin [Halomonas vilamensis]|uniref:Porin n=1 Tax=Vreelandella vilamensis TaxID=531309 RepID=A0ABU1H5N2_9GAMM|nr:porin [Halomonas vilamensis]MDR5899618.1 porin [Halomonas vilamensis]